MSAANISQTDRLLRIDTPLGKDKLFVTRFEGTEGISMPFKFELDLISEDFIDIKDIMGKGVTVSLILADGSERYFNGVVSSMAYRGSTQRASRYGAVIVPWFWMLTRRKDCRIFQAVINGENKVEDIVRKVFEDAGYPDFHYEFHLTGTYPKREYCVQYNETDFSFVSRLLEEEGIYYFFKHEKGKHTMYICDNPGGHEPCPNQKSAVYLTTEGGKLDEDIITDFGISKEIHSGEFTVNDYNFETPTANLLTLTSSSISESDKKLKLYEYPGNFDAMNRGADLARIRMEAEESQYTKGVGRSNCRAFASGYRFSLTTDDLLDGSYPYKGDYVLTSVTHTAVEGSYFAGEEGEGETEYTNTFTCIPHGIPYRPQRITQKPSIPGAQTAVVTGPQGKDIHTDQYGRVKVQFHWDRQGEKDEKTSCWIRVGQMWASKGYGAMFIPRIGDEVIVEFLEGNPDRPLITGSVYHAANMPPYQLPEQEALKTAIRTNTSPGGKGFNEISFEDYKGKEQIFIHGERNLDIRVKNDMLQTVNHDSNVTVKNNRLVTVEKDLTETVKQDRIEKIARDLSITVSGNDTKDVTGALTATVKGDVSETFKSSHSETVTEKYALKAKSVLIEADNEITLKVMNTSITITSAGITIKSSSSLELGSDGQTVVKGGTVKITAAGNANFEAGGVAAVTGSLVKIN
ncbi:MAG TPA: type VI secretion system tip protein TssI/VgrG [Deltaproteobacteria bacterium]|nr:type VI secretion system tip protein TssI/VgrG [Deltaproteobacteria bacterium]